MWNEALVVSGGNGAAVGAWHTAFSFCIGWVCGFSSGLQLLPPLGKISLFFFCFLVFAYGGTHSEKRRKGSDDCQNLLCLSGRVNADLSYSRTRASRTQMQKGVFSRCNKGFRSQ